MPRLLTSFQEGLEGDRGRDRVQRATFLTSFQEGPHQLIFQGFFHNSASKMGNCRYCQLSCVITGKFLANYF